MRIITAVCLSAVACLSARPITQAGDSYASYYAAVAIDGEHAVASPSDESFLCDSSSCHDCCQYECFDCCDYFNQRRRLLGMLPSDHCFDRFISPISNPFFFEDPRSLTEVRGIFLDNGLPNFLGGGDAQVWAAQFRGRLTDRASVIVPRVGYLQINQAGGGAPTGFMSTPVGFKYNFLRDVQRQFLASAGITYFINGSSDAASNFGDGAFHFFLTGGAQIFDRGHWLSATGFRIPVNNNFGTQFWYWSNQWDYELPNHIYPLAGINWFHWMRSANVTSDIPVTSIDLIDLPTNGVAGTNVVTGVVGVKYKPNPHVELGTAFEFPLTDRTDILRNRLYADLILRY